MLTFKKPELQNVSALYGFHQKNACLYQSGAQIPLHPTLHDYINKLSQSEKFCTCRAHLAPDIALCVPLEVPLLLLFFQIMFQTYHSGTMERVSHHVFGSFGAFVKK